MKRKRCKSNRFVSKELTTLLVFSILSTETEKLFARHGCSNHASVDPSSAQENYSMELIEAFCDESQSGGNGFFPHSAGSLLTLPSANMLVWFEEMGKWCLTYFFLKNKKPQSNRNKQLHNTAITLLGLVYFSAFVMFSYWIMGEKCMYLINFLTKWALPVFETFNIVLSLCFPPGSDSCFYQTKWGKGCATQLSFRITCWSCNVSWQNHCLDFYTSPKHYGIGIVPV